MQGVHEKKLHRVQIVHCKKQTKKTNNSQHLYKIYSKSKRAEFDIARLVTDIQLSEQMGVRAVMACSFPLNSLRFPVGVARCCVYGEHCLATHSKQH